MRSRTNRIVAAATAAAFAVTAMGMSPAVAAPSSKQTHMMKQGDVEVSAAKKRHRQVRRGSAAPLAVFSAFAGMIGSIAAANAYNRYYDEGVYPYGYGYAPYGYGGYYAAPYDGYYAVPYGGYGTLGVRPFGLHRHWR